MFKKKKRKRQEISEKAMTWGKGKEMKKKILRVSFDI